MTGDDVGFAAGFLIGWLLASVIVVQTVRMSLGVTRQQRKAQERINQEDTS